MRVLVLLSLLSSPVLADDNQAYIKANQDSGSSPKTGQLVGIIFHTPQDSYCQEQNESSLCYKNLQYNQNILFLSHLN